MTVFAKFVRRIDSYVIKIPKFCRDNDCSFYINELNIERYRVTFRGNEIYLSDEKIEILYNRCKIKWNKCYNIIVNKDL